MAVAFLITYGLSRLVFGIVSDWWGTKPLYLAFAGIQAAALLFAAVSLPSLDSIVVFTVLMCFVSSMFAAGKCIWMVALLKIYGPVNFQQAVHATLPAYGLAGFLGPYTLNAALQQSDVLSATSLWLAIMSGALALCFLLFLAIRPVDYGRLADGRAQRFGLGFGFRVGPDRF
jgi:sugar phosphate permease